MPRRRALRVLAVVAAAVVVALVAVVAVGVVLVRRPLPDHSGSATLPGLDAEVTVLRDARGVPSIYADTPEDLFRAQGYTDAQDRFFQMDLRRHVTAGRLAELVGDDEQAIASDKVVRTLGWRRVAAAEWEMLDDTTRGYLQAYADGVNAYVESRDLTGLGVEYEVLGARVTLDQPEPWDPIDSLAWLKAIAWDLRSNDRDEVSRVQVYAAVGDVSLTDELFPTASAATPIVGGEVEAASSVTDVVLGSGAQRAMELADEALAAVPHLLGSGDGLGSNSWVVSGEHTASGAPMLANDPHLGLSAPGVWSQVGLHCTQVGTSCPFDVSGFSFAGLPGVVVGHNADLAWGLTNMGADTSDFFLERTDPEARTYLRDGEQIALERRTETIEVAGGDPVQLEVRTTVHGPIVSDVLDPLLGAPVPSGGTGTSAVALAWTGLEPGTTAAAIFAMDTASDAQDVAQVAGLFEVPAQNIVFATTDGQIGYQAPGRIPVRARVTDGPVPSDGTWPRPGWDSRYDWQGWVPVDQLPAEVDPPEGFIVAANQQVTASGEGPFLARDWDYGYRAARIRDLLETAIADGTPLDVAAMQQIQVDDRTGLADFLVPALLAAPVPDEFTREAVALLRDWDGRMDQDSAAAAYVAAVWDELLSETFDDDLPESQWPDGGDRWYAVVAALLEQPASPWWDDRTTVNVVETRDEVLSRSLVQARLELTVQLGKDPSGWQWGRLHRAALHHPVLGNGTAPWPVGYVVDPTPVSVPGGSSIIDAMAWDAASGSYDAVSGPSMRMVTDLADWDAATWVVSTGTSGHPGSRHYTDQIGAWAEGRQYPWPFTADAVDEAERATLTLRPAG
ncbi:penicillin acylase family protein [Actinotalea sp. M2MS4P-6]|uniref:penicillin acylase family protein n=1 Tax=Actinotalea sp. M2MS4P-6 TaxID=2983762 RepID=UPI0021E4CF5C|nr:penicillin acylase family protein [Actinotalea sp. M2MS4P-6]MCV2395779.1 penicillin acylase family protein [Actinotalea sp. M2MS4P-6]